MPTDVPRYPNDVYRDHWSNWADWLGAGRKIGGWRPFKEAREFVRSLGLTGKSGWEKYCKSGNMPTDTPRYPNDVYRDHWSNWVDWLGAGKKTGGWRPFKEAREFVRSLGLTGTSGWEKYCKSGNMPTDIPRHPPGVYRDHWSNWADWLGAGRKIGGWRPFKEAREFVHSLGLTGKSGWEKYCKSGNIPTDIPHYPNDVYRDHWSNWADWLGK
jgi:hypothetical protein